MNINTIEGLIAAHTEGSAVALAGSVETAAMRQRAQRRFDVALPRDRVLSAKVL